MAPTSAVPGLFFIPIEVTIKVLQNAIKVQMALLYIFNIFIRIKRQYVGSSSAL